MSIPPGWYRNPDVPSDPFEYYWNGDAYTGEKRIPAAEPVNEPLIITDPTPAPREVKASAAPAVATAKKPPQRQEEATQTDTSIVWSEVPKGKKRRRRSSTRASNEASLFTLRNISIGLVAAAVISAGIVYVTNRPVEDPTQVNSALAESESALLVDALNASLSTNGVFPDAALLNASGFAMNSLSTAYVSYLDDNAISVPRLQATQFATCIDFLGNQVNSIVYNSDTGDTIALSPGQTCTGTRVGNWDPYESQLAYNGQTKRAQDMYSTIINNSNLFTPAEPLTSDNPTDTPSAGPTPPTPSTIVPDGVGDSVIPWGEYEGTTYAKALVEGYVTNKDCAGLEQTAFDVMIDVGGESDLYKFLQDRLSAFNCAAR